MEFDIKLKKTELETMTHVKAQREQELEKA